MRDEMIRALKLVVVPQLRERAFTGSFPHFRRIRQERIDMMTFQFDRHGGGFVIEIAQCGPADFTTSWGKIIVPKKITAWDLPPKSRSRIQPRQSSGTDGWFRFDDNSSGNFMQVATSIIPFLDKIEGSFDNFDQAQKVG